MISVTVTLSGRVSDEDVEAAQDFVRDATGGEAKTTRLDRLGQIPASVIVGGHGPGRR